MQQTVKPNMEQQQQYKVRSPITAYPGAFKQQSTPNTRASPGSNNGILKARVDLASLPVNKSSPTSAGPVRPPIITARVSANNVSTPQNSPFARPSSAGGRAPTSRLSTPPVASTSSSGGAKRIRTKSMIDPSTPENSWTPRPGSAAGRAGSKTPTSPMRKTQSAQAKPVKKPDFPTELLPPISISPSPTPYLSSSSTSTSSAYTATSYRPPTPNYARSSSPTRSTSPTRPISPARRSQPVPKNTLAQSTSAVFSLPPKPELKKSNSSSQLIPQTRRKIAGTHALPPSATSPSSARIKHARSQSASSTSSLGGASRVSAVSQQSAGRRGSVNSEGKSEASEEWFRARREEERAREREREAREHRKVLDLEITNASLVSLNATLEKGKAKQATEIRELRRRIRDQSLHLPFPPLPTSPSPGDQDDESDTEEEDWDQVLDADPPFREIARVMESLIRRGTNAVQAPMHSGTKVLGEGARIGIGLIRQESETSDLAAVGEESFVDSVYASIDGDEEESTMQEDSPGRLLPRYSEQSTASAASEPEGHLAGFKVDNWRHSQNIPASPRMHQLADINSTPTQTSVFSPTALLNFSSFWGSSPKIATTR